MCMVHGACVCVCTFRVSVFKHYVSQHLPMVIHVNLAFKGKQGNDPESPLFYFHRKKAA